MSLQPTRFEIEENPTNQEPQDLPSMADQAALDILDRVQQLPNHADVPASPYEAAFAPIYQRLNLAQRQAVDTIEGPVLVIAGPGTGKTEILGARIVNILRTTDARPENILCLTYTEAGTIAMRTRLEQFIGPDAYRVEIMTFHGFCNKVIQEQSDHFGFRGLNPVSELEQNEIVCEIIDSFPADHPLTRATGDIYYEAKRLLGLYEVIKQEAWSPEWLVQETDAWLASLAEDPEYRYKRAGKAKDGTAYKKGDVNASKLQEASRKGLQLKAAAETYANYQARLQSRGLYDFADMISWCTSALRGSQDLLTVYQDRYQYIMVDEYQDSSGSQFDLLMLLTGSQPVPNLFAVGDDSQSIYRFMGASVENIRRFEEKFGEDLTAITLTENHRSSQKILDAAAALIAHNTERLNRDKDLVAVNPEFASLPQQVELRAYPNHLQEVIGVVKEIEALRSAGVPLQDIAVIYRNHRQSEEIARALSARGISFATRKRADILQEPLIERILLVIKYAVAEINRPHSGEKYLFELLHEKAFGLPALAVGRLSVSIARLRSDQQAAYWREELAAAGSPASRVDLPAAWVPQFAGASQLIEELLQKAATAPLLDLVQFVVTKLGILARALAGQDKLWNLQLINTLFDFIQAESTKRALSVADLLGVIEDMKGRGIALPAEKLCDKGDGINLVSAHGSKGLQFRFVFLVGCTSSVWDSAGRNHTYTLPPTVLRSTSGSAIEESRRLFYVAGTRGRQQLLVSWASRDNNDKELERSRFVAELAGSGVCAEKVVSLDEDDLVEYGMAMLMPPVAGVMAGFVDPEIVDAFLAGYSMSVTHLNDYLRCPVEFYFKHVLRVPQVDSLAAAYGSAIHYALEHVFRTMLKSPGREFPPVETFVDAFSWYMERLQHNYDPVEYKRRREHGEAILPRFYEKYVGTWDKNVLVELNLKSVVVDGVTLNGKLDKAEFLDTHRLRMGDYKSGKFENARKKLRGPDIEKITSAGATGTLSHEERHGGDYWRQAVFYKILVEADARRGWRMDEALFDFVEPDRDTGKFRQVILEIAAQDVETVRGQIAESYRGIQGKEFAGCGDPECEWCGFAEQYIV